MKKASEIKRGDVLSLLFGGAPWPTRAEVLDTESEENKVFATVKMPYGEEKISFDKNEGVEVVNL